MEGKLCDACGNELVISAQGNWECISPGCINAAEALKLRPRRIGLTIPQIFSGIALVSLLKGDVGRFNIGSLVVIGVALENVPSGERGRFSLWDED